MAGENVLDSHSFTKKDIHFKVQPYSLSNTYSVTYQITKTHLTK